MVDLSMASPGMLYRVVDDLSTCVPPETGLDAKFSSLERKVAMQGQIVTVRNRQDREIGNDPNCPCVGIKEDSMYVWFGWELEDITPAEPDDIDADMVDGFISSL